MASGGGGGGAGGGGGGFRVERNVGGVRGLHVVYELISEEVERRLFMHPELFQPAAWFKGHRNRYHDGQVGLGYPNEFPEILYPVVNAARDTGLDPDMEQPDYCLCLSYPGHSRFTPHFDSRYKWGESILAVNLGAPCTVRFQKPKDADGDDDGGDDGDDDDDETGDEGSKSSRSKGGGAGQKRKRGRGSGRGLDKVDTVLPRRAAYVMTEDARDVYKHGIFAIQNIAVPGWNPDGMRRSLIFRATRPYNLYSLERQVRLLSASPAPADHAKIAALRARLDAMARYGCKDNEHKKLSAEAMKQCKERAEAVCAWLERNPQLQHMRLAKAHAPFYYALPLALQALYPDRPAYALSGSSPPPGGLFMGSNPAKLPAFPGAAGGGGAGGNGGAFQGQGHRLGGGGGGGGDLAALAALVANPLVQVAMDALGETEEDELQRALAASVREQGGGGKGGAAAAAAAAVGADGEEDEEEQLQRAIEASLQEGEGKGKGPRAAAEGWCGGRGGGRR